mgnify:CR=1 FL=1
MAFNSISKYENLHKGNPLFEDFSLIKKLGIIIMEYILNHVKNPVDLNY